MDGGGSGSREEERADCGRGTRGEGEQERTRGRALEICGDAKDYAGVGNYAVGEWFTWESKLCRNGEIAEELCRPRERWSAVQCYTCALESCCKNAGVAVVFAHGFPYHNLKFLRF